MYPGPARPPWPRGRLAAIDCRPVADSQRHPESPRTEATANRDRAYSGREDPA